MGRRGLGWRLRSGWRVRARAVAVWDLDPDPLRGSAAGDRRLRLFSAVDVTEPASVEQAVQDTDGAVGR